jgi:Kef-type K+ transport system membrane component KefB
MLVGRLLGEACSGCASPPSWDNSWPAWCSALRSRALFPDLQHALFPAAKEQKAMLDGMAQFGVLLILLMTGMETDLKLVKESSRASISASVFGIIIPFRLRLRARRIFARRHDPGSEQAADHVAVPRHRAVDRFRQDRGDRGARDELLRRTVGQVILGSAIVDDTIGWIIIAMIFGLALQGHVDPLSVAKSVLGTLAFMAFSLTIGRRWVSLAIRWVNDTFVSEYAVITAILVIMGLMALPHT